MSRVCALWKLDLTNGFAICISLAPLLPQASAFIKYVGQQEGGMDKLKGKKIALVYHNSAYGKEPIPTLEALAKKFGYIQ